MDRHPTAPPWPDQAACTGRLDLFYPPHGERPPARARRESRARRVCATCPVLDPCRAHARQHREHGLWGGETEDERTVAGYPPAAIPSPPVRRVRIAS